MQIQVMTLPLQPTQEQTEELNHFLRAHKVVDVKKELATADGNAVWTFCITFLPAAPSAEAQRPPFASGKAQKVDYREVLDADTFARFSELRKFRKAVADKDAVPAYAVLTDAELAEVAKLPKVTMQSLRSVPNIGARKVEKYGAAFCAIDNRKDETDGASR